MEPLFGGIWKNLTRICVCGSFKNRCSEEEMDLVHLGREKKNKDSFIINEHEGAELVAFC